MTVKAHGQVEALKSSVLTCMTAFVLLYAVGVCEPTVAKLKCSEVHTSSANAKVFGGAYGECELHTYEWHANFLLVCVLFAR